MSHFRKVMSVLLLLALLAPAISACAPAPAPEFDVETQGVVDVILRDYNDGTIHYDCVGPNQTRCETEPFASCASEILFAEPDCFASEADGNLAVNRLVRVAVTDADGNPAASTPVIDRIFEKAAAIPHEILKLYILRQDEHHFAVIEPRINAFFPCRLYCYNASADELEELYSYDATEVVGLRVRNRKDA